jgi:hypothetical protein
MIIEGGWTLGPGNNIVNNCYTNLQDPNLQLKTGPRYSAFWDFVTRLEFLHLRKL